jgi:predicted TIM-barrel fold metal-dependent hydrolase
MSTIDFHVHVFPNPVEKALPKDLGSYVDLARRMARQLLEPAQERMHQMQVWMRHLPEAARAGLDQMGGLTALPRLLIESTPEDLLEAMDSSGVDQAVVIAHPPFASNEWVLEVCARNPDRLIPVVNIPKGTDAPGQKLEDYLAQGARALKIHAAADGEGPETPRYRELLEVARTRALPVILHTGCIHNRLFYKAPEFGKVEAFASWFEAYPEIPFVLAHMNFHEPQKAIELGELHSNVMVDTSWQPPEMIGEAVRRLGARRVLFGTDWPFVGGNLAIGKRRIEEGVTAGVYSQEDADWVLGGNAMKLLLGGVDAAMA